ncbi:MAG: LysR family transcriptional regulator [Hyphomicrobiales bacterium]|nr:LysR family transcriptional regulator [Hyphomicrobiales bacterium]
MHLATDQREADAGDRRHPECPHHRDVRVPCADQHDVLYDWIRSRAHGCSRDLLGNITRLSASTEESRCRTRLRQSTVSLQIKKLEEGIGRRLFERNGRELHLTADGEVLLSYARRLLQLADEARSRLLESGIGGTVRLGTPEDQLGSDHGLPSLPDAEIAMYRAPDRISRAAELLAEHIVHSLEAAPSVRSSA